MNLKAFAAKYPFLEGNISFWQNYLQARDTVMAMLPDMLNVETVVASNFASRITEAIPFLQCEPVKFAQADMQKLAAAFAKQIGILWEEKTCAEIVSDFPSLELTQDGSGFILAEVHSAVCSFLESIVFPGEEISGWWDPVCPICGASAGMGFIDQAGKKTLVCSHCHTAWLYRRTLCGLCGLGAERGTIFISTDELPAWRVELCEECQHYLKVFDMRNNQPNVIAYPLFYLTTWELDLAARERGYAASLFAVFERADWLQPVIAKGI